MDWTPRGKKNISWKMRPLGLHLLRLREVWQPDDLPLAARGPGAAFIMPINLFLPMKYNFFYLSFSLTLSLRYPSPPSCGPWCKKKCLYLLNFALAGITASFNKKKGKLTLYIKQHWLVRREPHIFPLISQTRSIMINVIYFFFPNADLFFPGDILPLKRPN